MNCISRTVRVKIECVSVFHFKPIIKIGKNCVFFIYTFDVRHNDNIFESSAIIKKI